MLLKTGIVGSVEHEGRTRGIKKSYIFSENSDDEEFYLRYDQVLL